MKLYAKKNKVSPIVEAVMSPTELKILIKALVNLDTEIDQYKLENKEKQNLGFTHMHFIDCNDISKKSDSDLVFYVNLDEK